MASSVGLEAGASRACPFLSTDAESLSTLGVVSIIEVESEARIVDSSTADFIGKFSLIFSV